MGYCPQRAVFPQRRLNIERFSKKMLAPERAPLPNMAIGSEFIFVCFYVVKGKKKYADVSVLPNIRIAEERGAEN